MRYDARCREHLGMHGVARRFLFLAIYVSIASGVSAEGFFAIQGGIAAPRATRGPGVSGHGAFLGAISWGGLSKAGIGAGGGMGFFFQRTFAATGFDTIGTHDGWLIEEQIPEYDIRRTAFLPELALHIQPLPYLAVHPSATLAVGPALMVYTNRRYDQYATETELSKHSGGYWGWHFSAGAGIHLSLGSSGTSLFGRIQYRSCSLTKRNWDSQVRYRQDISGPAFQAGFQFL